MKVAAIVGPTASGKTELSIAVAETLDAEIVSLDSMQVYRKLDIGTAKATPEQRERVPHHLIDVLDPSQDLTVAWFQSAARSAIDDISARGRLPLLVGGAGLYWRAVVDDLRFPPRDPAIREDLETEAEDVGPAALHARLLELDPQAAARIDPANTRRIVRALEVIAVTGRPFSDNRSWDAYESIFDLAVAGLAWSRETLYERVEARVDEMLRSGLIAEARGNDLGPTARQALGYRQILDSPTDDVRDEIVRATKRFARRQLSWFRPDTRIAWFDASDPPAGMRVAGFLSSTLASTARAEVGGE